MSLPLRQRLAKERTERKPEPRPKPDPFQGPPVAWSCPRCGSAYLTAELAPRCLRCGYREGT